MPNFKEIITFEYENEYESAYDLTVERKFSVPKIYSAKGDLSKKMILQSLLGLLKTYEFLIRKQYWINRKSIIDYKLTFLSKNYA